MKPPEKWDDDKKCHQWSFWVKICIIIPLFLFSKTFFSNFLKIIKNLQTLGELCMWKKLSQGAEIFTTSFWGYLVTIVTSPHANFQKKQNSAHPIRYYLILTISNNLSYFPNVRQAPKHFFLRDFKKLKNWIGWDIHLKKNCKLHHVDLKNSVYQMFQTFWGLQQKMFSQYFWNDLKRLYMNVNSLEI